MAGSVNKVILIGYVGGDPDVRTAQNGTRVASFSIATSESWRDKNTGDRKEKTEWHRVAVWNDNLVKVVEQYVKKGSHLYVEASLKTRKWKDQGGVERYTTEVVLQSFNSQVVMLDKRQGGVPPAGSPDDYGTTSSRSDDRISSGGAAKRNDMDDEIPF